ncbi:hypothetical protein BH11ACT6_BH11ACT6_23110 [soil metagenome]
MISARLSPLSGDERAEIVRNQRDENLFRRALRGYAKRLTPRYWATAKAAV